MTMTTFFYGRIWAMALSLILMACSALAKEATVKGVDWRYSVVNGGFGGAHVENILWDIVKGGELVFEMEGR